MSLDPIVARSIVVPGFSNPCAFDDKIPYVHGCFYCANCGNKDSFYGGGGPAFHKCKENESKRLYSTYLDKKMIYLFGPNENFIFSPYGVEANKKWKIMEIAKRAFDRQRTEAKETR